MSKHYDVLVIGPVSLDHNIDYLGNERKEVGGAVVASGFAAARSGNATALFTKLNQFLIYIYLVFIKRWLHFKIEIIFTKYILHLNNPSFN